MGKKEGKDREGKKGVMNSWMLEGGEEGGRRGRRRGRKMEREEG